MQPKEDWHSVLREYALPFSNDYTFSPVDRRYLEQDFALPSIDDGEKIDWIAIAIDTSGSIGHNELSHFVAEVKSILSSFDKVKAKLTFCDADATLFEDLEAVDINTIQPKGGGGTDFRPVFNLIEKETSSPKAILYFTDLCGTFPKSMPTEYDILWISTVKNGKAPFGKILDYDIGNTT
jgi:predicted metal-dependent peptidase